MTNIYLIRHAEAEGNVYRRVHGQYDSLVTENGKKQIRALSERFAEIPITACYSSDLLRTQLTASAICVPKRLKLTTDPRFREVNMGVWEDVPFGLVGHETPDSLYCFNNDPEHWIVEKAEPYETYTNRFLQAMTEAAEAHPGESIAIVAHGAVIRGIQQRLFFRDRKEDAGHADNTAVNLLEYENGQFRLVYHNDNSHLPPEISTLGRQNWWRKDRGQSYDSNAWFRPLTDKQAYVDARLDAWRLLYDSDDGFQADGFWREARLASEREPNALVEVMLGSTPVGLVQLDPDRFAQQGVGYIPFLYLAPQWRGKEIGAQLLGHAVAYYRGRGRSKLQLSVSKRNTHALHFYDKYGFRTVGTTPGFHGDLLLEKNIAVNQYDNVIGEMQNEQ